MGDCIPDTNHVSAAGDRDVETYHISSALHARAAHHESFQQLWETKWKGPVCQQGPIRPFTANHQQCAMGVYPFMFGSITDFQPVVDAIIAVSTNPWMQFLALSNTADRKA